MKTKDFDYLLPQSLIAQKPVRPRDFSKLLVLERKKRKIFYDRFFNLGKYLKTGDLLILNNSRVIPARLIGEKPTGGKVEVLLLQKMGKSDWLVLIKGRRIKKNLEIKFKKKKLSLTTKLIKKLSEGTWQIRFNLSGKKLKKVIYKIGQAPTPPYIKRISNLKEYQTIYAQKDGSVAAPTAGFHFTKKLICSLKKKGIKFEFITLHIGLGTFRPIKTKEIEKHKMANEFVIISKKTAEKINKVKANQGRIIAVGTSTVRAIETATKKRKVFPFQGFTNLFIKPGYKFKLIDGLITNFHLPRSTNLVLVSAFANKKIILKCYQEAIRKKYRFYSFGDAMLII